MGKLNLFCIPYAGGSANVYLAWKKYLSNYIDLHPIELAGRGRRFSTPTYNTLSEAVDDVYRQISDKLDENSYAIFGHSMGSTIAYELGCKLFKADCQKPKHIFLSGRKPPHLLKNENIKYNLSDSEFINEIIKLGGNQSYIFENEEIKDLFIPILKADYKIIETYKYNESNVKLDCDISILFGKDDKMSQEDAIEWNLYTENEVETYGFKGGHFFINDDIENVLNRINTIMYRYMN